MQMSTLSVCSPGDGAQGVVRAGQALGQAPFLGPRLLLCVPMAVPGVSLVPCPLYGVGWAGVECDSVESSHASLLSVC